MHVTPLVWIVTLSVLTAILVFDVIMMIRKPHEPSMKEATIWICISSRQTIGGKRGRT